MTETKTKDIKIQQKLNTTKKSDQTILELSLRVSILFTHSVLRPRSSPVEQMQPSGKLATEMSYTLTHLYEIEQYYSTKYRLVMSNLVDHPTQLVCIWIFICQRTNIKDIAG